MSLVSQQLVHELDRDLEIKFEYRNPGSILICESDIEMEAAQQWVKRQLDAGLNFKMLIVPIYEMNPNTLQMIYMEDWNVKQIRL